MTKQILIRARPKPSVPIAAQSATADVYALRALLGMSTDEVIRPVNTDNVRGLPAANFALNKIANGVATMMTAADAYAPDGITKLTPTPTILARPLSLYPAFRFWTEVVRSLVMRGNFYGLLVDADGQGWHRQVIGLPPDSVNCRYDENGELDYEFGGEHYTSDEIVHVAMNTLPGDASGRGVIEVLRFEMGAQLDQQSYARNTYKTGAVPSGIVQLDVPMPTSAQVSAVKESWLDNHGAGQRSVAVLGKAMTFSPLSWTPEDAQFLESRQLSVSMLAYAFGMLPSDLGAAVGSGSALLYQNRGDNEISFVTHSLAPVMALIESEWSDLLAGGNTARGNVEALLRTTTAERYSLHQVAQEIGLETVDETREIEGKAPLPKAEEPPIVPVPEPPNAPVSAEPTEEGNPDA